MKRAACKHVERGQDAKAELTRERCALLFGFLPFLGPEPYKACLELVGYRILPIKDTPLALGHAERYGSSARRGSVDVKLQACPCAPSCRSVLVAMSSIVLTS